MRADTKSTIVTTNLAFDRWAEIIKDKVLVTALVDRLTHNAFFGEYERRIIQVERNKEI